MLLGTLICTPVVEGFIDRGSDVGQILAPKLGPSQVSGPQPVGT